MVKKLNNSNKTGWLSCNKYAVIYVNTRFKSNRQIKNKSEHIVVRKCVRIMSKCLPHLENKTNIIEFKVIFLNFNRP